MTRFAVLPLPTNTEGNIILQLLSHDLKTLNGNKLSQHIALRRRSLRRRTCRETELSPQAAAEDMFALLKQYGVRLAVEDTIQLENMLNSANDFEQFKLLDAAEHIRSAFLTSRCSVPFSIVVYGPSI